MENGIADLGVYLSPDQYHLPDHLPADDNLASFIKDVINHCHFSSPHGTHARPPDKKAWGLAL